MGRGRWYLAQCLHLLGAVASVLRHWQHSGASNIDLEPDCKHTHACTHTLLPHLYTHCPRLFLCHMFPCNCYVNSLQTFQTIIYNPFQLRLCHYLCNSAAIYHRGFFSSTKTICCMIIYKNRSGWKHSQKQDFFPPSLCVYSHTQRVSELECSLM